MTEFIRFGTLEINSSSVSTLKKDFVKAYKGRVPDVEKALNIIKKRRTKTSKRKKSRGDR